MATREAPESARVDLWERAIVEARVPARECFIRTLRLVASDVAARAGFDVDASDDIRLAITELCAAVLKPHADLLTLRFAFSPGALQVNGFCEGTASRVPQLDEMAAIVVDCVADHYDFGADGNSSFFSFEKRSVWS
ncbi:MAG TPA: hypothetical protein VFR41_01590 [Acidimicrobiia bacterium]|nr:hypothetical protein [Acidimicrobiia bacterium]